MFRFLLGLFVCQHGTTRRERDEAGVLHLVCESCGHSRPAMLRDDSDAAKLERLNRRMAKARKDIQKSAKAKRDAAAVAALAVPENVTPMRRKGKTA